MIVTSTFSQFLPRPFRATPQVRVRWRGTKKPLPVPVIVCDSIAASKAKCGFTNASLPSRYFLDLALSYSYDDLLTVQSRPCSPHNDLVSNHLTGETTTPGLGSYNSTTCVRTKTAGSYISTSVGEYCSDPTTTTTNIYSIDIDTPPSLPTGCTPTIVVSGDTVSFHCDYSIGPPPHTKVESLTYVYSNEYTTAILKTTTVAALPVYSENYGGGTHGTGQGILCSAYANLSSTESSYTIRRFKHKFTITAQDEAYDLRWKERFIPTLAADVTYMGVVYHVGVADPDPSHWVDTDRYTTIIAGDTESAIFEVLEPTTNGTITIVCVEIQLSSLGGTWPSTTCWP